MGYDVWVDPSAGIAADKVPAAARALWDEALKRELIEPDSTPYSTAEDLEDAVNEGFSEYIFTVEACGNGSLDFRAKEDYCRRPDEDQWIFEAMGPFIDGCIEFKGEDGALWRWDFSEKGGLEEVDSDVVFGADIKAPAAIKKIVEVLYPDGKPNNIQSSYPQVLDEIETILREAGFGPFAGMSDLDAIAKAVE
jgi:hypothetical protein